MLRTKAIAFVVVALGTVGAFAACGGDDVTGANPTGDGGTDGMVIGDGGPGNDSGDGGQTGDGGDGGPCDFNQFVIGLIQNHTNSTDLPSTDLGQNCTDTQTPFPSTVFQ